MVQYSTNLLYLHHLRVYIADSYPTLLFLVLGWSASPSAASTVILLGTPVFVGVHPRVSFKIWARCGEFIEAVLL